MFAAVLATVIYRATGLDGVLGMYVSFDDGDHWQSLRIDMPAISVRDITVKDDEKCLCSDLVAATHGRGFWILDDVTPLRAAAAIRAAESAGKDYLVKPATAVRIASGATPATRPAPIITSGEVVLPVDTPVLLRITSRDVIHSFWIPKLNGKRDAVPGRERIDHRKADVVARPVVLTTDISQSCKDPHDTRRVMVARVMISLNDRRCRGRLPSAQKPEGLMSLRLLCKGSSRLRPLSWSRHGRLERLRPPLPSYPWP